MKIKYNNNLEYQTEAVESVVGLFEGAEKFSRSENFSLVSEYGIIGNKLDISSEQIKENLQNIQERNFKKKEERILDEEHLRDFSVEMETGTGKTYTYIKTTFELNKKYGFLKFIVIVPSVAIREGVIKTLETTQKHFFSLYKQHTNFRAYDGDTKRKMTILKDFSASNNIEILVMSIQAFNSDNNIINQEKRDDVMGEKKMIDKIAKTKPIIILDEPQNMESELSKSAIDTLSPLFKLRYSATHKDLYNLVYSLSPFDAYNQGLVKKIEIASVVEEDQNKFIFEPQEIVLKKGQNPKAKIKIEVKNVEEFVYKTILFYLNDDVERKTNNEKYKDLFIEEISKDGVEISGGKFYKIEKDIDENKKDIFRVQIRETIKEHFTKQEEFGENIKVLSLFFIDKVKNYVEEESLIRNLFEEEFENLKSRYTHFKNKEVKSVHNGYFSSTGKTKKVYKDTNGNSISDKEVYNLIMKDKERLLSFSEDIAFIFSHSALKEGWDNPNVFQICTLNETRSKMKKRQEIGRGMRLALDRDGNRIYDKTVNKLVVVPNESYKDYVATLQSEFKESGQAGIVPPAKAGRKKVKLKKEAGINLEEFKKLWKKINKKTRYNITIRSKDIVEKTIKEIDKDGFDITKSAIKVERQTLTMRDKKISTIFSRSSIGKRSCKIYSVFNTVNRIEKETGLTKKTILKILNQTDDFNHIFDNPELFVRNIAVIIKNILRNELVNGIEYRKIENEQWSMGLFKDIDSYKNKVEKVDKSIYDYVIYDSDGEKEFAKNLNESTNVRIFAKLPSWFVVDTPIGDYNPDWAIVWNDGEKEELYLIRETKFYNGKLEDVLKKSELQRIICARKHFEEIGVDFNTYQKTSIEQDLVEKWIRE